MTNELLPSTAQVLPEEQRGLQPPQRTAAVLVALGGFIENGGLYGVADGIGFDGLRSAVHDRESPLPGARGEPATPP